MFTSSVKDVELVQADTTALILSCVEPVEKLARTYRLISPLVDCEEFTQIGMLRVCELASSVRPGAQAIEQLSMAASEAMLDELGQLIQHPTTSLEDYLSSCPADPFMVDPFSDQVLPLVSNVRGSDGDIPRVVDQGDDDDVWLYCEGVSTLTLNWPLLPGLRRSCYEAEQEVEVQR